MKKLGGKARVLVRLDLPSVKQLICGSLNRMRIRLSLMQPYITWTGTLVLWKVQWLGSGV